MDRNSQQPHYSRDRPLIHNPNHHAPQQPPSYAYPPPTSQAPVHVPFNDPYNSQNRDPFHPNASQHQRRGSYGLHGGNGGYSGPPPDRAHGEGGWTSAVGTQPHHQTHQMQHHSTVPPPPPPPPLSAPHHPQNNPAYSSEHQRFGSAGGGRSPPASFHPSSRLPPPPPPINRNMPPPSPQKSNVGNQYPNQQQSSESYSANRELPGLGQSHRPGSALSISSLLGGDSSAPRSHSQVSPPTVQATASPATRPMQPPSPRRAPSSGPRNDFSMYGRPRTPERYHPPSSTSRPPDPHSYNTSSPTRPRTSNVGSPERNRQGLPHASNPYNQHSGIEPRHAEPHTGPGIPPRPTSQPSHGPYGNHESDRRSQYDPPGPRRPPYGYMGEERKSDPAQSEDRQHSLNDRDRPITVQPLSHSAYSPPKDSINMNHASQNYSAPRGQMYRTGNEESHKDLAREELGPAGRLPFGPPPQAPLRNSSLNVDGPSRSRMPDYPRGGDPYTNMPPTSDPTSLDRRPMEQPGPSGSASAPPYQARGPPFDPHQRAYHLGPDANRKTGRASPLPQAVQGASLQPTGPGGNPNIKSEFGRMFSGLGGGASAPSRNGTATPSRQSPLPQNGMEAFPHGPPIDPTETAMARVNSQSSRRSNKRVKDEDFLMDHENGDGRATPLSRAPGQKKPKHHHPPEHHHHHRGPGHHHHHVHPRGPLEGEDSVAGHSASPFNMTRAGANGSAGPPDGSHHHHHHHMTSHHHHVPRSTATTQPDKLPEKTYNVKPVLDSVKSHPSGKAGSCLYNPEVLQAPAGVSLDDKFGYTSVPKPLPYNKIYGKVNHTFVIRVPRYFLSAEQRELVTRQRYLWGDSVYRDDSDPIAAAIHSGWILGSWGEMHDLKNVDGVGAKEPEDISAEITKKPSAPIVPPADVDLHITVLIIPPLESYHGSKKHGIGSRKAGSGHGGMSYMIQSMKWIDEAPGSRGHERNAQGRKERMDAAQTLMNLVSSHTPGGMTMSNGTALMAL